MKKSVIKVILINPPSPYLVNDAAYPPSGLMYIAAVLEKIGHEPIIVDLSGGIDWRKKVGELDGDLFGITCVTPNFMIVKEIANLLPSDRPIIIGGVHPTFLPDDTLSNIRCNAVIKGEAEVVIKQVMEDLMKGSLKKIYDGGLIPVAEIPKPARHLVNLHRYYPGGEATTPIYSSRGCPFNCAFCSKVTGRIYRSLPIDRVIEEVQDVIKMGFRHILFGDDDIGIQSNRLKEILLDIKPFNLSFRLNQDAKTLNEDVISLAGEAGCTEISFGIESGSPKMLNLMNKKASIEDNKWAIQLTKAYGMKAKAYFVVNFPGENEETIKETIKFVRETMPDKWLLSAFAPLPGSPAFHHPKKYGINWISPKWEDYYIVGKDGSFKPCFTTDELTFEKQIYLHDILYQNLKEILGCPTALQPNKEKLTAN